MSLRQKISTLWIVVMFNMAFADILSFITPGFFAEASTGTIDGITITPMFILIAAIFVEVGIAMIFLTHVLKPKLARIANLVAVGATTLFVVGGGSLAPHYIFIAGIEIVAMLYIVRLAWTWHETLTE